MVEEWQLVKVWGVCGNAPPGVRGPIFPTEGTEVSTAVKELFLNEPWLRNGNLLKFLVKLVPLPRGYSPYAIHAEHLAEYDGERIMS